MIVSLGVVFEILSILLCIHCLYGERIRWDKLTIGFEVVHFSVLMLANNEYISNLWSLIIYPIIMLYCGLRFGWDFKKILINVILCAIVVCMLQTSIMICLGIFLDMSKLDIILGTFINAIILLIMLIMFPKIKLKKFSDILQRNERIIAYSLVVIVIGVVVALMSYKNSAQVDIITYLVIAVSIILIGFVIVDIGKHKMKVRIFL